MLVVQKADEVKKVTPHLALTHEAQGGPANGRKVSLLMKNQEELTPELRDILETILKSQDPKDEVVKASYEGLSRKLEQAVQAGKKGVESWGWAYVRDFDDDVVVYSNYDGVFACSYTENSNGTVSLGNDDTSVNAMITYEDTSGNLVLTESDSISSKVSGLVVKSFQKSYDHDEKLKDIFKTKHMEKAQMTELQKSLDDAQAEIATLKAALEKSQAELQEVHKAAAEAKSSQRKELLKAVASEDDLEALHKSLDSLEDSAFETVLKTMKAAKETVDAQSGLFTQISKSTTAVASPDERGTSGLTALLKARNPQAQA